MFDNFDFDDFFERFMVGFMKVLTLGLLLSLILIIIVGIYSCFVDIPLNDFMEITHNDGSIIIYRNPSNISEEANYINFKSEGKTYTIFYKDIKSIEQYNEDIAKGIYK